MVDDGDANCLLLQAIQQVFAEQTTERLLTVDLLTALVARDGEPWGSWWGEAVSKGNAQGPAFKLSKLLKRFGITTKSQRVGDRRGQGYELADFTDAFARYLNALTPGQPLGDTGYRELSRPDASGAVRATKPAESVGAQGLSGCQGVGPGDPDHSESKDEFWL